MREKLLVASAALAAFGASLVGAFQFDDFALLSDPAITWPGGWLECFRLTQTRPLTWFSFWLNYQIAGENAWAWHALNLALHVAVALLVLDLLQRLLAPQVAMVAALVFAVHPMMAEPVNYVFARGTLLAALFSVLAARSWIADRKWIAAVWFALAMLAKEEAAAVPVFLAALDWSRGRPLRWAPLAAMWGVDLVLGVRVLWATTVIAGSQAGVQAGISPLAYLAVQGVAIWRYLRMLAAPWGFTVDVEIARPASWLVGVSWAAIIGVSAVAARRYRGLGIGFFWVGGLILLAPSSSILPASDLAADRRLYLPMIAFSAVIAVAVQRVDRRIVTFGLLALMAISIRYSLVWRTPESLWREAAMRAPDKLRPRLQLARVLPPEAALKELDAAQRIAPSDPAIWAERGRVLLTAGRSPEALAVFGRALALDPGDARALNNRGAALAALGQTEAARADFQRALDRDPCLFDAKLNLKRLGGFEAIYDHECRYTPAQQAQLEAKP